MAQPEWGGGVSTSVAILAGGTGGHVMPALAVAEELSRRKVQLHWFGRIKGLEADLAPDIGLSYHAMNVGGLRGLPLFTALFNAVRMFFICARVWLLLRRLRDRPQVAIGFGGYVSVPPALACLLNGIPLVVHEQNAVLGSANQLLGFWARQKLTGHERGFHGEAQCVGNPVRSQVREAGANRAARKAKDRLNLLVLGGSQGAAAVNRIVPEALALLGDTSLRVHHLTGQGKAEAVQAHYRQLGIEAEVEEFSWDMPRLYRWASLAVCRAGAMTLAELAVCGLPAVLLPLPGSIDSHQLDNGVAWQDAGAGICLPDRDPEPQALAEAVKQIGSAARLEAAAKAAGQLARPDAAARIADSLLQIAGGQK